MTTVNSRDRARQREYESGRRRALYDQPHKDEGFTADDALHCILTGEIVEVIIITALLRRVYV